MKSNLFLLLTIILVATSSAHGQIHGTSPNWTPPTSLPKPNTLGDISKGGIGQNIIQLSTGELIQCFTEKFPFPSGPSRIYFAKSTDDGLTWSIPVIDTPFIYTNVVFAPTIAKDTSDNIHIIWQRNVPSKDIYYAKFDKNFNVLIDTVKVTQFNFHNSFHSAYVTVDRSNKVHVMWHDGSVDSNSTANYFAKVMYRQSPNGGISWNNQLILSDTSIHKHAGFPRANFNGADGDTLAIPWRQFVSNVPSNWDVWIAYSINSGNTWSRILAAGTDSTEWDPGIVVDKNNRIHLHYHEYKKGNQLMSTIEYIYSDNLGNSWSPIQTLSPTGIRGQLSVFAYDYVSDIHCICWKDERDFVNSVNTKADVMCSFSTNGGINWLGQEFVNDLDSLSTGFKSVEVGNNNTLYVTYEYADSTGRKSIWFSKRQNTVSIFENEAPSALNWELFPNPARNNLEIITNISDFNLQIFDLNGCMINSIANEKKIDISNLNNGIYMLILYSNNTYSAKKIIIQN